MTESHQITVRMPEDLLAEIAEDVGPEESRSQWLRQAARARLEDDPEDYRQRIEDLERRLDRVEGELDRSLLDRLLA